MNAWLLRMNRANRNRNQLLLGQVPVGGATVGAEKIKLCNSLNSNKYWSNIRTRTFILFCPPGQRYRLTRMSPTWRGLISSLLTAVEQSAPNPCAACKSGSLMIPSIALARECFLRFSKRLHSWAPKIWMWTSNMRLRSFLNFRL